MMVKGVATASRTKTPLAKDGVFSLRSTAKAVSPRDGQRRVDRLVALIDRCCEAKAITEEIDAPFLAYLLSMAIQEARTELRGRQP